MLWIVSALWLGLFSFSSISFLHIGGLEKHQRGKIVLFSHYEVVYHLVVVN